MKNISYLIFFIITVIASLSGADSRVSDQGDWPLTDFNQHLIPYDEFFDGGPGRDGIPAIDQPQFDDIEHAEKWLNPRDPVIVYVSHDQARAYPLQILMYHEIVNDIVGGQEIAVTYCPLCNAAMVFSRRLDEQVLGFGVSGKVHASNLVMFDRQTESWWLQFTGQGVVGKHTGEQLRLLASTIVSFEQFKESYPNGQVLNRHTGYNKKYGVNPYHQYDSRHLPVPWFFRKALDTRLPAMERVLGLVLDKEVTAFPFSFLNQHPLLQMRINDRDIIVINAHGMASPVDRQVIHESKNVLAAAAYDRRIDGRVLEFILVNEILTDKQTRSRWNLFGEAIDGELKGKRLNKIDRGVYFAFVWLDFYSQTEIITTMAEN